MSDDKDKVEYARKMERYRFERNAWLATGLVFMVLFAISAVVIYYLASYLTQLCGQLYQLVDILEGIPRLFGLPISLGDPCPNLIDGWP